MFFSRKKPKATQAPDTSPTNTLDDVQKEFAEIEKIADAGGRYLALADFENKIQNLLTQSSQKIDMNVKEAKRPYERISRGLTGTAVTTSVVGGIIAMAAGISFGPFIIAGATIACTGCATGTVGEISAIITKKQCQKSTDESLTNPLNDLLSQASRQRGLIIQNQLPALLASSSLKELCDRVPAIKAAFVEAAIKGNPFHPTVVLNKTSAPTTPPRTPKKEWKIF